MSWCDPANDLTALARELRAYKDILTVEEECELRLMDAIGLYILYKNPCPPELRAAHLYLYKKLGFRDYANPKGRLWPV